MTRTHAWRRIAAVLLVLAGLCVAGIALPSTASAIPGISDCKDAPTPEVPGRGVEAFFAPAPAQAPQAGDPFVAGSKTSIFEQYGYAGLRWNTYDLGCTGGAGSPEASVGSTVANWLFTVPKAVVSATGALLGAAYEPSFLSVFDPLVATVVDALRSSVFEQWAGLVLAGLGFLIVWRARRSSLRTTAAAIGWALFVMVLATILFRWPVAAGRAADATVTSTMSAVTAGLNQNDPDGRSSTGRMAAANLHDALLYQVWLGGQFGDANSVTARRYSAALFDAQALTWSEAATLSQDPAAGQRIIEAKKAKFKQVAAQVKAEDPDAYEYLTGRRSDARIGFAALALLAVACAVPFLLVASLLVIGALVITRFAVMLFPAIATLGLFPAMRSLVIGVGNTVAAAVINALVFGIGTAVMVKAYGVVMAPGNGLPAWLVVALVLLLTLVMWFALRPFQRLTGMVAPGRDNFTDAAGVLGAVSRGLGRVGGRLATTAAGVLGGGDGAGDRRRSDDDEGTRDESRDRRRAEADPQNDAAGPPPDEADDGGRGHDRGRSRGEGLAILPRGDQGGSGGRGGGDDRGSGPPDRGDGSDTGPSGDSPGGGRWGRGRRPRGTPVPDRADGGDTPLVAAAAAPPAAARRADVRGGSPSASVATPSVRPSAPATRAAASPAPRRSRPPVRRSEGADLDDLGVWSPAARGGPTALDDAGDPYAVYRPEDRAESTRGGTRGGRRA